MKNKYLLALSVGAILLVTTMVFSMLLEVVFPTLKQEYVSSAFRPWDDPLMSLFFLYPIALGVILTWLWLKTRKSWKSGIDFGVSFAILLSVPMFLVNYSSFTFSLLMVGSWTALGFLNTMIVGLVLEKLTR